jgi:hypothetical protein
MSQVKPSNLSDVPKKKYIVTLTEEERSSLEQLVSKGKNPAYQVNHARVLLLLVDDYYPQAYLITVVQDNLNTHTPA